METIRTTVVLPVALYERFKAMAYKRGWPVATLTRELIKDHVHRQTKVEAYMRAQKKKKESKR